MYIQYTVDTCQWTDEEDSTLLKAVNKNGIINWVDISLLFPQKTAQECYNRWYNDLNFGFRKVNTICLYIVLLYICINNNNANNDSYIILINIIKTMFYYVMLL